MKKWLLVAVVLTVIGTVIFVGAFAALGFDLSRISCYRYVTSTHTVDESICGIEIKSDTANVKFLPHGEPVCKVLVYEKESCPYSVYVEDDILKISPTEETEWYEHLVLSFFSTPEITVYLPAGEYASLRATVSTGDVFVSSEFSFSDVYVTASTGNIKLLSSSKGVLKLKTDTGNISVTDICAKDAVFTTSTGNIRLSGLTCTSLDASASTGNISLTDTVAEEVLQLKASTGNIKLDRCDGEDISLKTSTGNITGTLLSEKVFHAHTSTGRISVPDTKSGGVCNAATSTGNINISLISDE